ncbi:SIMPL domain-containing protein [Wenjunlia tyrosinilytica]|nr:SIMPL domain-containing protein [Wenjunlia tyrosinilytica]
MPPILPSPFGGAPTRGACLGTPDEPRVTVVGEALLEVQPELATIGITVRARGKDRRGVLDELTRRNAAVLDLLKSHSEALDKLDTGAFTISPRLDDKRGEKIRGYQGAVRIRATLTDFTALGELATRLADLDLTEVDGPWWSLRHDSPVHREARQKAVGEAVQRAREYAGALGAELTALVELCDTAADREPPRPYRMAAAAAARSFDTAAEDLPPAGLDLEPELQCVRAQVTALFTITRPELNP